MRVRRGRPAAIGGGAARPVRAEPRLTAILLVAVGAFAVAVADDAMSLRYDPATTYTLALPEGSPVGEASIREHAIAWHPAKRKYYLIADVIPVNSPHHPNTYDTELYLWSSPDLSAWEFIGVAVEKGLPGIAPDGYGVASPAGMAFFNGRLYVPFSARRTPAFTQRSIGLAWSGADPEVLPWTKADGPISDLAGEDDDAAAVVIPGDARLHVYHRTTGAEGYRIVHTASATPEDPSSWPEAKSVTIRPPGVRAQELTGAFWLNGLVHLFVIEQGSGVAGIQIAHLADPRPDAIFRPADPDERYVMEQPDNLAYGGAITPVIRDGKLEALFWTVWQTGKRYGLCGHPVLPR